MHLLLFTKIIFSLVTIATCTDLFAVLNGGLYMVRNADGDPSDIILTKMDLPVPLVFPVAVTHDMEHHRLFLADLFSKDGSIYVLQLTKEHELKSMDPVFKKNGVIIEAMFYDPRLSMLYWTDAGNPGLWKMEVPETLGSLKSAVHFLEFEHFREPRGLSFDFCNETLYWTERGPKHQYIEVYNFNSSRRQIFKDAEDSNLYFQVLNVDLKNSKLIWTETVGDDEKKSSCIFKTSDLLLTSEDTHLELENCYPFSLAHDEKYIYWNDWAAKGLFRVSRTNGKDVKKLVDIPTSKNKDGYTLRYFGLTTLMHNVKHISDVCSNTGTPHVDESEQNKHHTENHEEMKASNVNTVGKDIDEAIKTTGLAEEERTSKSAVTYDLVESTTSGPPQKSKENIEIVPHPFPQLIHSKRKNISSSDGKSELSSADCIARCNENFYLPVLISLAVLCVIFMVSTMFLLVQHYRRVRRPSMKQHFPRRFGPKKNMTHSKPSNCHDDGVRIDIEDCCQMTVCETPCYTSVKREGGSERLQSRRSAKGEEVKVLLDDSYNQIFD